MMIRKHILPVLLAAAVMVPGGAIAAGGGGHIEDVSFSFEGPFGTYDQHQLQRGFQVYNAVCAGCHGLQYLSFRDLGRSDGHGFPEEQVKAIAANYICLDPEHEDGERACLPSDNFPANTGVGAPDLTLMAKARAGFHGPAGLGINQFFKGTGGPEYIYSVLTGYTGEEVDIAGNLLYYNEALPAANKDEPAGLISMAQPLLGDDVEYAIYSGTGEIVEDGHGYTPPAATIEQEAKDIAAFLMFAAEPTMVERKSAGFRNLLMILLLAVLLYYTNKKLWAPVKRKDA